ncbi:MAG TPA: TetR/AcrR family transcriptional regulator [Actinomycetota bacterium]|nr:TetR/AcrR family transcriptional regulator [Actinomycetota bacterium]
MPKVADPAVRDSLVETAARLIAEREPLSTRRLAAELGTSTMAVYTHFGSMDELRRAVRRDGFARLAEHMAKVHPTKDPVADLALAGHAYCVNALRNPHLYRVMFMETPIDQEDAAVGLYTFEALVAIVQRCIDAGRFKSSGEPWSLAVQAWIAAHGVVTLFLAGMMVEEQAIETLEAITKNMLVGFGDDPGSIARSFAAAEKREEVI